MQQRNRQVPPRLKPLDAMRGTIMALMALDHASYFIARMHSREFWGTSLPVYPSAFPFLLRLASHICAPGFFFLMGVGMVLLTDARLRSGWSRSRLFRFFLVRGGILMLLQFLVENPSWGLAFIFGVPGSFTSRGGPLPGSGEGFGIYFGVLFALGAAMVVWSCLMHLNWRLQLGVALGAILLTQWLTPSPEAVARPFSEILRLVVIPGRTGNVVVFYPVLPWFGIAGLGIVFARGLIRTGRRQLFLRWTGLIGGGLLILFLILRSRGGIGNLHPPGTGWVGFLNLTKYPPSLTFICLTLGINGLLLTALSLNTIEESPLSRLLSVYGRTPLFFYGAHLYLYGVMGWLVPGGVAPEKMVLFWLTGLGVLYPLCRRYDHFKRRQSESSIWRFF